MGYAQVLNTIARLWGNIRGTSPVWPKPSLRFKPSKRYMTVTLGVWEARGAEGKNREKSREKDLLERELKLLVDDQEKELVVVGGRGFLKKEEEEGMVVVKEEEEEEYEDYEWEEEDDSEEEGERGVVEEERKGVVEEEGKRVLKEQEGEKEMAVREQQPQIKQEEMVEEEGAWKRWEKDIDEGRGWEQ